jgi:hypothetical protein
MSHGTMQHVASSYDIAGISSAELQLQVLRHVAQAEQFNPIEQGLLRQC